tara:strand:+ start:328 stop:453 length:126 start_codon:yes stop_codon:yes gene_type:complete
VQTSKPNKSLDMDRIPPVYFRQIDKRWQAAASGCYLSVLIG